MYIFHTMVTSLRRLLIQAEEMPEGSNVLATGSLPRGKAISWVVLANSLLAIIRGTTGPCVCHV
jgi:hypothetical protein